MIKVRDIAPVRPPKVDAVFNTVFNTQASVVQVKPKSRPGDRHKPGYMRTYLRTYMAKRRTAARIARIGKTERSSTSSLS